MAFDIGYHVVSAEALEDHGGGFEDRMSIVEFLRRVDRMDDLPLDVTVEGLDTFLRAAEDHDDVCELVHDMLRDRVNYLNINQPTVQFVVDDLENWNGAVIPDGDEKIRLNRIFHGSLEHSGSGWWSSHLNVQS